MCERSSGPFVLTSTQRELTTLPKMCPSGRQSSNAGDASRSSVIPKIILRLKSSAHGWSSVARDRSRALEVLAARRPLGRNGRRDPHLARCNCYTPRVSGCAHRLGGRGTLGGVTLRKEHPAIWPTQRDTANRRFCASRRHERLAQIAPLP